MADTDIDAIKRQKKAEYNKRYILKRMLLLQQQASTSSESELAEKQKKKAEYDKQYRLKRKLQMQQQALTSSKTESAPSIRRYDGDDEEDDNEIFDFVVVRPKIK
jgi:poly-D-alanine transfer protein DltD